MHSLTVFNAYFALLYRGEKSNFGPLPRICENLDLYKKSLGDNRLLLSKTPNRQTTYNQLIK